MNDETIGLLGMFSFELLKDPRFDALKQMFGQQMAADMLNTAPHEQKKREGIHAAYCGFNEFVALLNQFSEAYQALYDKPASTNDEAQGNIED